MTNCNGRDVNMLLLYRGLRGVEIMERNRLSNVIIILFVTIEYYRFKIMCFVVLYGLRTYIGTHNVHTCIYI